MWKISLYDLLPETISNAKNLHPLLKYIFTEEIGPVVVHIFAVVITITIIYTVISTLKVCKNRMEAIR